MTLDQLRILVEVAERDYDPCCRGFRHEPSGAADPIERLDLIRDVQRGIGADAAALEKETTNIVP